MRLTQLRSFHAVAQAGGFTGGARLLHISQPTVTTQVRFLEETYGIELFYRRGRTVRLTPLGEQLFRAYVKQILVDGFFHADPHPGNVLVTDEEPARLPLIDLGMVARLPNTLREQLAMM